MHGIPKVIISDQYPKFTGNFWKTLFTILDTKLNLLLLIICQQMEKQKELNQVLDDMSRMHVRDCPKKWEDYLHLVEISYIRPQQSLSPFEILYGRNCNTPITWNNPVDRFYVRT